MSKFGSQVPFAEPSWYDDRNPTPYYNDSHRKFRAACRAFVDEEIIPNVEKWEAAGEVPITAFKKAGDVGMLLASCGWPEGVPGLPERPEGFDAFWTLIYYDELSRCGSGGVVWGLTGGFGIGLPPVVHYGSDELKARVAVPCLRGEKRIALAVSEPGAGSDVANIETTAIEDGDEYVVNGTKKWITCGMFADFFTAAVRTGGEGSGMAGVSLLLIEKFRDGVSVKPMDCMGVRGSGTALVEFDEVRVPKANLVVDASVLLRNFVTERIGLAIQATRFSRVCLEESIVWARNRKTFGKRLVEHQIVKFKIAHMAREIEASHALIESLTYRISALLSAGDDWLTPLLRLGAEAALCKVQATRTFEHCARDAAHLHGGSAYVKGNKIESLYRHVLSLAIPGGSEDVMIDAAARLSLKGKL